MKMVIDDLLFNTRPNQLLVEISGNTSMTN